MSANSGGSRSLASMERSCPTFIAAPRICASWLVIRMALPGVSSRSLILGRPPDMNWRVPLKATLPATPAAIPAIRAMRDSRPLGTAIPRGANPLIVRGSGPRT